MRAILALLTILVFGAIGSAVGMWLALPPVCFTLDNLTHYTPECRQAIRTQRFQ